MSDTSQALVQPPSNSVSNRPRNAGMQGDSGTMKSGASTQGTQTVDAVIAKWSERPRLGATQMIAKYGAPQDVTAQQLVWHNQGRSSGSP